MQPVPDVLDSHTMGNMVAWFASDDQAYIAIERYYPEDTRVEDQHQLAPVLALLHVAAKVGGMPCWDEARDAAARLQTELRDFVERTADSSPRGRQAALDVVADVVPRLAYSLLQQLHGLRRPGHPVVPRPAEVPRREVETMRTLGELTLLYLRQRLVMRPKYLVDVLKRLRVFTMCDSDSDSDASTVVPRDRCFLKQLEQQLAEQLAQMQLDNEARDARVEALQQQLDASREQVDQLQRLAAEARAGAVGAEQIAEAAEGKAAAAQKQAAAAERLARAAPDQHHDLRALLATASGGTQQLQRRVLALETAVQKEARQGGKQQRGTYELRRELVAEMERQAAGVEARLRGELEGIARRVDGLPRDDPRREDDYLRRDVQRLTAEMAWMMPQFQQQFCDRWNGVMAQWQMQARLQHPLVPAPHPLVPAPHPPSPAPPASLPRP